MKPYFAIVACLGTLAVGAMPAQANDRHVQMSISIGVPGIYAPPVYVAPPPPPAVIYYPAPYGYYYYHRPHYYHGHYEGYGHHGHGDEGYSHYGHDDEGYGHYGHDRDDHDDRAWRRTEVRR